jgi:outer membrane biosynthesis protein TonB
VERDDIVRDLAQAAAERLADIVDAAEKRAADVEAEARAEAERIVSAAREEASDQVERAQGAVSRLVEQADELRSAIGKLGSDIATQARGEPPRAEAPAAEVTPQPPVVPEPSPPREPEPAPPSTPEPTPPPTPEPTPPQTPEPQPPGPQISSDTPSTDDLLAQLKGGASGPGEAATARNGATEDSNGDVAAARLVAMKMALDGASRDEIAAHLEKSFSLSSADELLDDVLARAKP